MSVEVPLPGSISASLDKIARTGQSLPPTDQVMSTPGSACPAEMVAKFRESLLEKLEQHGYAVVVDVLPEARYIATALIAEVLGGLNGGPAGALGGEITTVVTSSFFDHNLAWHTDSTSWELPNRWQILTLVQPDSLGRPAPTSVLPWTPVLTRIGAGAVDELRSTKLGWREQFPDLPPLSAPVLGSPPRWLRPALGRHLNSNEDGPLPKLAAAIAESEEFAQVDVSESSIVVFDNHAVLHRGPHLDPDGGRTIIRLKLGGKVGDLDAHKTDVPA